MAKQEVLIDRSWAKQNVGVWLIMVVIVLGNFVYVCHIDSPKRSTGCCECEVWILWHFKKRRKQKN